MTTVVAQPSSVRSQRLLEVRGLSKTFPGLRALDRVDLEVDSGEIVAVLGQNGSGKSTLVKVLAGIYSPDDGAEIRVRGSDGDWLSGGGSHHALHFIHQDLGLVPTLSVIENLDLSRPLGARDLGPVSPASERTSAESLVRRFGGAFDVRRPVADLTPAERTIVAISRALAGWKHPHQVLVLDEPTAALHGSESERLFDAVRAVASEGAGVIFISHRLDEVFALADRVVVLRDGQMVANALVTDLDEARLIRLIAGRDVGRLASRAPSEGAPVLAVHDLCGEMVDGLDLNLRAGEVVGIAGLLGSGREHVSGLLFGTTPPASGRVQVRGRTLRPGSPKHAIRAGIGFVPGDRLTEAAFLELSVRENLTLPRLSPFRRLFGRLDRRAEVEETERWIATFGVRPGLPECRVALLSGGNQQKVMLARWMRNDPAVLLLDEPTQGVDVGAKATIYELIGKAAEQGRAILVVSSDEKELVTLCDRVVVMRDGVVVAHLSGSALTETAIIRASLGVDSLPLAHRPADRQELDHV